jgi:hypothetical protein
VPLAATFAGGVAAAVTAPARQMEARTRKHKGTCLSCMESPPQEKKNLLLNESESAWSPRLVKSGR